MMQIAVPSAYRHDRKARSLEQLESLEGEVDVVFYVPYEQEGAYLKFLPRWIGVRAVSKADTVNVARNAITADYMGDRVVVMEDDVPWFVASRHAFDPALHSGPPSSPRLNIAEVARLGWGAVDATGLGMWGVYPVAYSGTALKPRVGVGAMFCVGHAVGLDLTGDWQPFLDLPIKEDYQLTALALDHWGAVVRLDCVAPYSVSGKGEGGTRVYRNPQQEGEAAEALIRRWPALFEPGPPREGLPQVKMVTDVQWHTLTPEPGWQPYGGGE